MVVWFGINFALCLDYFDISETTYYTYNFVTERINKLIRWLKRRWLKKAEKWKISKSACAELLKICINSPTKLAETFFTRHSRRYRVDFERKDEVSKNEERSALREDLINYSLRKVVECLRDAFIFDTPYCEQGRLNSPLQTEFLHWFLREFFLIISCPAIIE